MGGGLSAGSDDVAGLRHRAVVSSCGCIFDVGGISSGPGSQAVHLRSGVSDFWGQSAAPLASPKLKVSGCPVGDPHRAFSRCNGITLLAVLHPHPEVILAPPVSGHTGD